MPKVSILCVTYNHVGMLSKAIDSFLSQKTDFDTEIIIHDDSSTDGTQQIIKQYLQKYPTIIKPIYEELNQVSQGKTRFLDKMFRMSTGEYIALCDGDDYWTDDRKLQKQVDFLDNNKNYALSFHTTSVLQDGKEIAVFPDVEDKRFTLGRLIDVNYIQTNTVVYRRQDYSSLACEAIPNDWYLHLFHARFGKIGFIDEVMAAYRLHTNGIWQRNSKEEHEFWVKYGSNHLQMHERVEALFKDQPRYLKAAKKRTIATARIIYGTFGTCEDIKAAKTLMRDFSEVSARLICEDQYELNAQKKKIDMLNSKLHQQGADAQNIQNAIEGLQVTNKRLHHALERTLEYRIIQVVRWLARRPQKRQ